MTAVFISVCYHIVRNCYSGPFIIVYLYDVYIAELLMLFANSILSLWHYSHLIESGYRNFQYSKSQDRMLMQPVDSVP